MSDSSGSIGSADLSGLIDSDMSGSSLEANFADEANQFLSETIETVFNKHKDQYNRLLSTGNIVELKEFIQMKFNHIVWGEFLQNKLEEVISTFATEEQKRTLLQGRGRNACTMIYCLRQLLEAAQAQTAVLMDISFDGGGILEGAALNAVVQESRQKMGEVLKRLQDQIRSQQAEITMYQGIDTEAKQLREELDTLNNYVKQLRERDKYNVEEAPAEEDFMAELKYKVKAEEDLNSSLKEELEEERKMKEKLKDEYLQLEAKRVQDHQQRLQEIAAMSKDIELEEGLRRELLNKLSKLSANREDVEKAVNEWLKATHETVESKQAEIKELKSKISDLDEQIAKLRLEYTKKMQEVNQRRLQLQLQHEQMIKEVDAYHRELRAHAHDREVAYNKYLESLDHGTVKRGVPSIHEALRSKFRQRRRNLPTTLSPEQFGRLNLDQKRQHMERVLSRTQHTHDPKKERVDPAQLFPRGSPESYDPAQRTSTPQPGSSRAAPRRLDLSGFPGPSRAASPALDLAGVAGPSRARSPELFRAGSPEMEMQVPFDEEGSVESDPSPLKEAPFISVTPPTPLYDTETFESLPSPDIGRVDPTTQTLGGVTNRFDIGKSFNLQTIHDTSLAPYSQVTRVDSQIPEAGASRMTDLPLNVSHTTTFTPKRFQSPVLSTSRFGYTDPTAKVLNLPPGPFQMGTPLRQTVVLTSPKRQEPLLVNIDVDAKPLEESESGEHFICDISLDLQPAGQRHQQQRQPKIKSKYTYGVPPSATPSTTRRHGLFTPRGIFKKRHYNVRRIYRPDEYQSPDLPWSPTNLSEDETGSPPSPFPPSPYYSDRSLSWERPDDYPSEEDSPVIKGPFYGGKLPSSDISQSPSPLIKGPYRGRFAEADSTPETSPSPIIKGPYRGRFAEADSTPESSPSPIIKGPSYAGRFPRPDSPSPVIQGPSYGSRSPPSYSSRSPSPVIQAGSYRSPSSATYSSRSPSPVIPAPSYRSTSPSSYSSRSPSPVIQAPSYRSPSSETYSSRSPSPMIQGPSYRSPSPATYSSRSPSPVIKGPFSRSPDSDRTTGSTPSPRAQRRFDGSPPSVRTPLFGTPPSGYAADLDSTGTQEFSRSFSRSASPDSGLSPEFAYLDDTLNRRHNLDEMLGIPGDRSPSPQMMQVTPPGHQGRQNREIGDPLNRRMRLDEMIPLGGMGRSPSPQMNRTPERASPLQRSSDYSDSGLSPEFGYLDDTLNRRHNLDEMLGVPGDRSPSPQMMQVTPPGHQGRQNREIGDPLNRRMRLDEMIPPGGMGRSPPQMNRTPERASPSQRSSDYSDDSELGGYLDSDGIDLDESVFYR